jgi:hypothetical protein
MPRPAAWPPTVVAFAIALVAYVGALLAIGPDGSGDQAHYLLEARSLAHDGDRDLADEYASADDRTWALGFDGRLEPHAFRYGDGEHLVSVHGVGLPLLLAPIAAVTDSVLAMRLALCVLAALAAALLLDVLRRLDAVPDRWRWAAWAAMALSLPWVIFAGLVFPEAPGALCALVAVRALLARPPSARWALAAGVACAALPWLHVRYLPIAAGLLLAVVVRARSGRARAAAVAPFAAGVVVLAVLWHGWYGSLDPRAPYEVTRFAATVASEPALLYPNLLGTLLSPDYGWLPWAPAAILVVAALGWVCWRFGRWATYGALLAAGYLLMIGVSSIYPSFNPPARFVVLLVPVAALPLALALARWRAARLLFVPLAALTALWTVVGVARPGELYGTGRGDPQLALAARLDAVWPHFTWDRRSVDVSRPAERLDGGTTWRALRLPEGTYVAAASVEGPAGAARLVVTADGETLADERAAEAVVSTAFAVPPGGGTVDLRLVGDGTPVRAGGMQVVSVPNTLHGEVDAHRPQVGLTIAWLVVLAGASVVMVVADRRAGQRSGWAAGRRDGG